jgi:hypothetical protein
MAYKFPVRFLCLREALKQVVSAGIDRAESPSERTRLAVKRLRKALFDDKLDLYAVLASEEPTKLANDMVIACAIFPANSVLTFRYIDRHRGAPFELSWRQCKALTRDRLCVEAEVFRKWLREQIRAEARSQKLAHRNPAGRPSTKRDRTKQALLELSTQGKLKAGMPTKELHRSLLEIDPSLEVALDTVRRAAKEFCGKKISGTSTH